MSGVVGTSSGDIWRAFFSESRIVRVESFETASINLTTIAANAAASTTITRHDVNIGDVVLASPNADPNAAATWSAAVFAKDTITLRVANNSGSAIDPAAGTWNIIVIKLSQ